MPGLKAGWIVVEGEAPNRSDMLSALDYISDSFLPVQEITQSAIEDLLGPHGLREADRLSERQRAVLAQRLLQTSGWNVAVPQAGPYICLPLTDMDEDLLVEHLVEKHGTLFHPGHLYAFPDSSLIATIYNQNRWPEPHSPEQH